MCVVVVPRGAVGGKNAAACSAAEAPQGCRGLWLSTL
jgi:hypothetical protein